MANAFRAGGSQRIIRIVSENFGISRAELVGDCRRLSYVIPRHIVMYILIRCLGFTTTLTGHRLGKRDHSTVVNGVKSLERRIRSDPAIRARVEYLVKACGLAPLPLPL